MAEVSGSDKRWKDLMDKLSSIEDLQNLTQLDIINLKNEVEKIKLVSSSPIPDEVQEKIVELENIAKNVDVLKRWKQTIDEVKFLRSKILGAPVSPAKPTPSAPPVPSVGKGEIDMLRKEIGTMRNELAKKKFEIPKLDVTGLSEAIQENRKTIEYLKNMIAQKSKQEIPRPLPEIDSIRSMVTENRKLVEDLRSKIRGSVSTVPAETHGELESLHSEITKLESEMKRIREDKLTGSAEEKDDISLLRKELFTKLEDLNRKFSSEKTPVVSEELKKAMEANKASIEKLKTLIVTEGSEAIRSEIASNRKFMEDIKRILLVKKPKGKVVLPPDPTLRKQMLQIEQKVNSLGRKLEKMNNLKPIKLPEFGAPKAGKVRKIKGMGDIKGQIEDILSKMDGFVTKEDVEKGLIESRAKTDEKLLKDDIYKEMEDIKKNILMNEDHINNLVADVESLKKEVGAVEKREWGKVSEIPNLEELKEKVENLENRVKKSKGEPLFIE